MCHGFDVTGIVGLCYHISYVARTFRTDFNTSSIAGSKPIMDLKHLIARTNRLDRGSYKWVFTGEYFHFLLPIHTLIGNDHMPYEHFRDSLVYRLLPS